MNDLISRQDVIELAKNSYYNLAESIEDTWAMVAAQTRELLKSLSSFLMYMKRRKSNDA